MTDDASLDEFADAEERTQEGDSAESTSAADPSDSPAEPARPTFVSSTDETACDSCGDATTRRWRDGDALVCASCKEW